MPKKGDSPRRNQLIAWLDAQTEPDAWLTKTYQQIGEEMAVGEKVSAATVRALLAPLIAERLGVEPSEVLKRKNEHRKSARGYLTPDKIRLLKEWRTQDPPVPIVDCAYRLEVSHQAVYEQCKKMGLETA